jgi:hypothetical protein
MKTRYHAGEQRLVPRNLAAKSLADRAFRQRLVPPKKSKEKHNRRNGYLRRQILAGVDALSGGWPHHDTRQRFQAVTDAMGGVTFLALSSSG